MFGSRGTGASFVAAVGVSHFVGGVSVEGVMAISMRGKLGVSAANAG